MADKRRYTVSLPDHVADAVEKHASLLGSTPTEYAADVIRWWFGQGCPPVTHDEAQLRKTIPADLLRRLEAPPKNIDVWALDAKKTYSLVDDNVVQPLLVQLGLPNLFAQAKEHDKAKFLIAFDNHPTHWLVVSLFKGSDRPDGDGLLFEAIPKATVSRKEMGKNLLKVVKEMGADGPAKFSQLPALKPAAVSAKGS
jgi:hypothetical protein